MKTEKYTIVVKPIRYEKGGEIKRWEACVDGHPIVESGDKLSEAVHRAGVKLQCKLILDAVFTPL